MKTTKSQAMNRIDVIEDRLSQLDQERQSLLEELQSLRDDLQEETIYIGSASQAFIPETPEEKLELYLSLFRCRSDVYPKFWKNTKTGKTGYSPACENESNRPVCQKPKVRCSQCEHQRFYPFDQKVIKNHLTGFQSVGAYAINQQDQCIFLAADFDKSTWKTDVFSYQKAASEIGVEVAIEISKSGNGAHAWIFFSQLIPARVARTMGELILSRALDLSDSFELDSYDRFFPNQDLIPSGGFGNLIFLPLQKTYRNKSTTVFVDHECSIIKNPWKYLAGIHRLSLTQVETLIHEYVKDTDSITVSQSIIQQHLLPYDQKYHGSIVLRLQGQIVISLRQLPNPILKQLLKMATISNPKFFQAQRMRFSTWDIPKYIFCGNNDKDFVFFPRGLRDRIIELLTEQGFSVKLQDERNVGKELKIKFIGELYDYQKPVVEKMAKIDMGVMVAPTGTGKTVMATSLIAQRACSTLILVHRSTLIQQWIVAITTGIEEIEKKDIGVLGAGRRKLKGNIDIAMLQSLARKEDLKTLTKDYAFVIVDECHRVPTVTFEPVLQSLRCRYILGLTATPKRKDQFQSIIYMQCGGIAAQLSDINLAKQDREVSFIETNLPEIQGKHNITQLWDFICSSEERNNRIVDTIVSAIKKDISPIIISDRLEHIEMIRTLLQERTDVDIFVLSGHVKKKERNSIIWQMKEHLGDRSSCCLFATGSLVGEGFDLPELNTMILTMPISFSGRLTQYVGRLHRQVGEEKKHIMVYDFVDSVSGMTISMFKKRISAYKKLGYKLKLEKDSNLIKYL